MKDKEAKRLRGGGIKRYIFYSLVPLILLFLISTSVACPANPNSFDVKQPDGSKFKAKMIGDEKGAWTETEDGYTIVQDKDKYWTYAELKNNQLAPTANKIGKSKPTQAKHTHPETTSLSTYTEDLGGRAGAPAVGGKALVLKGEPSPQALQRAPVTGSKNILVILINFTDTSQNGAHTPTYYTNLIFNASNNASMWAYYNETSYSKLNITGSIANSIWHNSSNIYSWYGANGGNCVVGNTNMGNVDNNNTCIFMLAREALTLADSNINFSQFDTNSNHILDSNELSIIIVHAGGAEESGGGANSIWSHRWYIYGAGWNASGNDKGYTSSDLYLDGVKVTCNASDSTCIGYTMQAEASPVGIFAHEFGHDIGLPDLYNTASGGYGIGDWDIMASGAWNGPGSDGTIPAHFSAWSKYFLGWIDPIKLTTLTAVIENMTERYNITYMALDSGYTAGNMPDSGTAQYFLIENRQKVGFDAYLPGDGLLIWQIDDSIGTISSNNLNTNNSHKRVDLEEADGTDTTTNKGDSGDPWKSSISGFTSASTPNSNYYNASVSGVNITAIGASGSSMRFIFGSDTAAPLIQLLSPSNSSKFLIGTTIDLNVTDLSLDSVLYSKNGAANQTLSDPFDINTSSWSIGSVNLTLWANDTSANSNSSTFSFTAEYLELFPTNVSTPATLYYGINTINATIQNSGNFTASNVLVYAYVNGTYNSNQTTNISANSSVILSFQPNLTYGTYNITFSVDPLNSTQESNETNNNITAQLTVSPTPPTISVSSPATNANLSSTVSISANITDADSDLNASTAYYAIGNSTNNYTKNGSAGWSSLNTTDNVTFTDSFSSTAFAEGNYTVYFKANDTNGSQQNASVSVKFDNTAPSSSLSIEDTSIYSDEETIINCTASDAAVGVANISIAATSNQETNPKICYSATSCSADYNPSSTGTKSVTCTVYDYAGNSNTNSSTITVSSRPSNSSGSSSSGGGGDLGLTEGVSKTFDIINPGEPASWSISEEGLALTEIDFNVRIAVGSAKITAINLDSKPSDIDVTPAGKIYQYIELKTSNLASADLSSAVIEFKVPKSWITQNNLDKSTVTLLRYASNGWQKLTTKFDKEAGENYYYIAQTSGFSVFAIRALELGGTAPPEPEVTGQAATEAGETTGETTSAFTGFTGRISEIGKELGVIKYQLVFGVVCVVLLAVILISFSRRKKHKPELLLGLGKIEPKESSGYTKIKSKNIKI